MVKSIGICEVLHKHTRIAQVEQRRYELCDLQLCEKVEDAIKKYINSRAARHNKTAPPPAVVLHEKK